MISGVACRVSETNIMSTSDSCKDGASKSNDDGVFDVKDMLNNMSINDNTVSVCANCGKEGDDINNICNKCKMVKYCNAACKKKHRHKHKKDCEEYLRTAAEHAAEKHDEELFKQPPPEEDCPICFLMMPTYPSGYKYYTCCGKVICSGCVYAPVYDNHGNVVAEKACPYCRVPVPKSYEEHARREKKRVELDDPIAIYNHGNYYRDGRNGYPQDYSKALELWHRAGELGYADAYCNIGVAYDHGEGAEVDMKKAAYYYELGAMGGDTTARHNLGINEMKTGNIDQALRHYMIAVRSGKTESLKIIKELYSNGHAIKDDYTKALRSYQEYLVEIKSCQRDKAAEADEKYRYY